MTAPDHPFDRDLTGVRLAFHLGEHHRYHSSNDLEDFQATHRRLHGVPSASEEARQKALAEAFEEGARSAHRPCMAKAWDEGYAAGDRDCYNADEARTWNGRALDDDELTRNPYAAEDQPVSTVPVPNVRTNPELWR